MSGPLRKVPRIMSKSNRTSKVALASQGNKTVPEKTVEDISIRESELDDDHEQLLVRDGIVVGLQRPNGRFVDEAGEHVPSSGVNSKSRTRRIVIESTTENSEDYTPYVPTTLPGVADEVESYPCPLCPERVFLTSFGLERHSTEQHPEHLQEIIEHINVIGSEWRRREEELARRRDRLYATRLRQESIAKHAIEQVANGTLGRFPGCLASSENISTTKCNPNETEGERHFKACGQCGTLVDANSPAVMESHLRVHRKNDDLRMKLLERYGAEEVGRLICRECNMVFGEESGLLEHNEQMHIRRRKFICKWCGHVTYTMTELNMHKVDVHALHPYSTRSDRDRILRRRILHDRGMVALGAHPNYDEIEDRYGSVDPSSSGLIFRTSCDQCGLRLVRPSLLVRHMLRVHSKSTFSCEIETPDACNYKIDVDCERITWTCCDNQYSTRREFFQHRMDNHLNKIADYTSFGEYDARQNSSIRNRSITSDSGLCVENPASTPDYIGEIATGPDGSMQVVIPREVIGNGGEFYIVVENDGDLDCQNVGEFTCVQTSSDHVQPLDDASQRLQLHSDPGDSSTKLVEETLVESVDHNEDEIITITAEQYEQLQLQYGNSLEDMSIVYVDQSDLRTC
ncbi:hypothetical protein KIN20_006984 [Parelaphostrongylus tenuis]|uniref:C2H2-type domain-containing protein n=1 Tax=Parelaphostrongylus tenuis TaxID=148309 RepID=A0AAD5M2M6_PARTN|nr:hypothetical protein KIN20_006984 [Parelaphostrongylus tenuis]